MARIGIRGFRAARGSNLEPVSHSLTGVARPVGSRVTNANRRGATNRTSRHTYNVLDAYTKCAEWVNALASEFGGTDEKMEARVETPDIAPFSPMVVGVAQAWLLREAADATFQQARASLTFSLAGFTRLP